MAGQMSPEELASFLARPVFCRLGCLTPDGRPYVIPLWFTYADGGFYFVIRERADWAPYVVRDGRVSLCIDSEQLERVLAGFASHPNVAAYVLVGLGCEVGYAGHLAARFDPSDDAPAAPRRGR
jgi:hypothetical protein